MIPRGSAARTLTAIRAAAWSGPAWAARPRRAGLLAALLAVTVAGCAALAGCSGSGGSARGGTSAASPQSSAAAANPNLDPGSPLGGQPAPDIRLQNQFGQPMSLAQFRGKVVLLGFVDPVCTTVCPLTTLAMLEAKQMLGAAGSHVQLLGIGANPEATAVPDVMAYSRAHNMVNRWDFLTGTLAQLKPAWKAFHIYAQVDHGQIDHTPALFVIDSRGREQKAYLTSMAYSSIGQSAQVIAQEVARLLPGHPAVSHAQSLAYISGQSPARAVRLASATGGSPVALGPGRRRLVMFFATWLSETSRLRAGLTGLNAYVAAARQRHLPALTAVDEAVTEPAPGAARALVTSLKPSLAYPVGLDTSGRVADGYRVQDQPWFALTSASGKIVWSHDGWLSPSALEAAAARHG